MLIELFSLGVKTEALRGTDGQTQTNTFLATRPLYIQCSAVKTETNINSTTEPAVLSIARPRPRSLFLFSRGLETKIKEKTSLWRTNVAL